MPKQARTTRGFWKLADQDSNLDKQNQNLLCYRYTTGQSNLLGRSGRKAMGTGNRPVRQADLQVARQIARLPIRPDAKPLDGRRYVSVGLSSYGPARACQDLAGSGRRASPELSALNAQRAAAPETGAAARVIHSRWLSSSATSAGKQSESAEAQHGQ